MARDGLFFESAGRLNSARVPAWSLGVQGVWAASLVLPRTFNPATAVYGNLYADLLDYVISAALLFYILTIAGVFRLRATRPEAERPYRAFGYPVVPALYIAVAGAILLVLFLYRPSTTWPGLAIALLGVPVYLLRRRRSARPERRMARVSPHGRRIGLARLKRRNPDSSTSSRSERSSYGADLCCGDPARTGRVAGREPVTRLNRIMSGLR